MEVAMIEGYQHNIPQEQQVLHKAILRLAEKLALTRKELAGITGMSEASMSRFYDGKRHINPHSKEGELALLLLRIYRSLDAIFGSNAKQCQTWLRSYNHHLQAAPMDLLKSITGLVEVASYLDAHRGKI